MVNSLIEQPRQGQVWWASFDKIRPGVVMSRFVHPKSFYLWMMPLTAMKEDGRVRSEQVVIRPPEGGLTLVSLTQTNLMQPIYREQLVKRIGWVSEETMQVIVAQVQALLGAA